MNTLYQQTHLLHLKPFAAIKVGIFSHSLSSSLPSPNSSAGNLTQDLLPTTQGALHCAAPCSPQELMFISSHPSLLGTQVSLEHKHGLTVTLLFIWSCPGTSYNLGPWFTNCLVLWILHLSFLLFPILFYLRPKRSFLSFGQKAHKHSLFHTTALSLSPKPPFSY